MAKDKDIDTTKNKMEDTQDNSLNNLVDNGTKKQSGIHDGHRERMRNRIREHGIKSLEEHEVLEYILFHFVPRKDVNALAHNMINEFGCLYNVLSAEVSRLEKVPQLSKIASLFLSSFVDIYDIAQISRQKEAVYLKNVRQMIDFAAPRIANAEFEQLLIILLDINNKVIDEKVFTNKNNKSVVIKRQQIVTAATDVHADKVIMAHNHPSGDFYPSDADIEEANNVRMALSYIGIGFVDSLILTRDKATTVDIAVKMRNECRPYYSIGPKKEESQSNESYFANQNFGTKEESYYDDVHSEMQENLRKSNECILPEINIELIDKEWLKSKGVENVN